MLRLSASFEGSGGWMLHRGWWRCSKSLLSYRSADGFKGSAAEARLPPAPSFNIPHHFFSLFIPLALFVGHLVRRERSKSPSRLCIFTLCLVFGWVQDADGFSSGETPETSLFFLGWLLYWLGTSWFSFNEWVFQGFFFAFLECTLTLLKMPLRRFSGFDATSTEDRFLVVTGGPVRTG